MANRGPYILEYDASHLRALIRRMNMDAATMARIGRVVQKLGLLVQTRVVYNVTGHPVVYEGGVFVVRVRTGALRGSIEVQYPYTSPLLVKVFVNGTMTADPQKFGGFYAKAVPVRQYAWAIEQGHGEIDLKKTMMGKTVPFFASRSSSTTGPYSARGLEANTPGDEGFGATFHNKALNARLQAKGKAPIDFTKRGRKAGYGTHGNSAYYIAFRKVGKTGWIIPAAQPRPFMRAAGEGTMKDQGRLLLRRGVIAAMRGEELL